MKLFSDIAIGWLIPWGIFAIAFAWWYYRKQKQLEDISSPVRWGLTALRAVSLFLIGALLIGLLFETKESKTQKPQFITLTDNSSSMLNYRDSLQVKQKSEEIRKVLEERFGDDFDFSHFTIGAQLGEKSPDYAEQQSDLNAGFEEIYARFYNQNIGGICFISDGNFNTGKNPAYAAEKIALTPIFTIGVGDTILKKDQLIKNVSTNDIAFYRNEFPIEIDVQASKMGRISSEVSVWKNGKKLQSATVNYEDGNVDFGHVSLLLEASEIGFNQYTIQLEEKENESSYSNNEWTVYVEVIDSRNKILLLSNAPHPDVAAIKGVIETDENVEVESVLANDWDGNAGEYQLIIWHDPGTASGKSVKEKVESANVPVWYLVGNQSSTSAIGELNMGLNLPRGNRTDDAQASFNDGFQLFELSEETRKTLEKVPPLTVPFGQITKGAGDVLIRQRVGPVEKKEPILYFGSSGKKKFGVLIGEGLWRWKLTEYAHSKSNTAFNELIQKSIQYLVVKKNTDALRINMPKRFNVNEEVIVNAEFYNSSLEPITKPSISFVLTDENGDKVDYEFAKRSLDYRLVLGKLKPGQYSWSASALFNGKKYSKNGVFVVEDISIERLASHANHNLLNQIASNSNGGFYQLSEKDRLIKDISERKDIVNVTYEESAFRDFIDYKWVFFLLILLLGAEWFIRRRLGSY